jgi:hypothetical protein
MRGSVPRRACRLGMRNKTPRWRYNRPQSPRTRRASGRGRREHSRRRHEAGKAPTLAVQPAGLFLRMAVATQRLHGGSSVAIEGGAEPAADVPIARTPEVNELRPAQETGGKLLFHRALHQ